MLLFENNSVNFESIRITECNYICIKRRGIFKMIQADQEPNGPKYIYDLFVKILKVDYSYKSL